MKICIIGCGPGSPEYLTPVARKAAMDADYLIGSKRLLELIPYAKGERMVNAGHAAKVIEQIEEKSSKGKVAVLVSGDPGVSSLARPLIDKVGAEHCRVIAGISSVQVAFAAIGQPWQEARIISAHGANPEDDGPLAERYAVLLGRPEAIKWAAAFAQRLDGEWEAWVCQNLTMENEKIVKVDPAALAKMEAPSLALVLLVRKGR
ncbi:MAG: precorrin-6y C5,15-methyltransferase (decarboxylating) subunit CbiE [Nitrospinota bacterium]|nr:precorrin-6y C5,15-methyltransferase (decarboxylating) subunit CbiE [Nitrospinota bacterium]